MPLLSALCRCIRVAFFSGKFPPSDALKSGAHRREDLWDRGRSRARFAPRIQRQRLQSKGASRGPGRQGGCDLRRYHYCGSTREATPSLFLVLVLTRPYSHIHLV